MEALGWLALRGFCFGCREIYFAKIWPISAKALNSRGYRRRCGRGARLTEVSRRQSLRWAGRPRGEGQLTAIKGLVVAAEVGATEGVAVGTVGSKRGIVAGSVVEFAVALRVMAEAVV